MSKYADKRFWIDALDRAVSTFAQTALASVVIGETGLIGLDWVGAASVAGAAALASVLTSIAFRGKADDA